MNNRLFAQSQSQHESLGEMLKRQDKEFINKCISEIRDRLIGVDDVINDDGDSLVHFVASFGNTESLDWLIKNGANIHLKIGTKYNRDGYCALYLAALKNNIEVVKFLLEQTDSSVDESTRDGATAFLMAVHDHNEPLIDLLYKHGADVNASYTRSGGVSYTFLEFFLSGGFENDLLKDNLKSAEMLLKLNATITQNAIKFVIRSSSIKGVKLLIHHGACFTQNLLEFATRHKDEMSESLEKKKQDLNLNQDKLSVEKRCRATKDIEMIVRTLNKRAEIETLIESALSCNIKLRSF